MSMARLLARDRATLSRFLLKRKSMCRDRYSWLEKVMETMTTSASLSLGLVHGADPGAGGQFFLEQIHLHVVGRHDENVIQGHRLDIACFGAVGLLFQPWDQLPDQFGLLDAGLGAGIMMTGNESDPGFREDEIIGALEHQALAGTMCFRRQAAVIGHFGNEPGDVRMHPKGFGQKNSPVFRVRQQPYKHYTDVDEVINKINSAIDEKKCIDISYFAVSRKTTSPRRVALITSGLPTAPST
jgi:hypothetical protein